MDADLHKFRVQVANEIELSSRSDEEVDPPSPIESEFLLDRLAVGAYLASGKDHDWIEWRPWHPTTTDQGQKT
jgi:hypothetical protein